MKVKNYIVIFLSILTNTFGLYCNNIPKVSIIVSTNNGDDFVEGFLDNITKQTIFSDCEFILINPNYATNKEALLNQYRAKFSNIRYLKLDKDVNFYQVLNLGIKLAKSDFIANFNIQDRFNNKLLEDHYNALKYNSNIDLVYSGFLITQKPNETFEKNSYRWVVDPQEFSIAKMSQYLPGPAPVWRKEVHKKNGYFNTKFKHCANWQMWLKAVKNGSRFKKIDGQYTLFYADPNSSENSQEINQENASITQEYENLWKYPPFENKALVEKNIVVIIPSYNNKFWFQKNLSSVFMQNYKNYRVIYIDDTSNDMTGELVEKYIKAFNKNDIVTLIKNKERKGALQNLYYAIHSCDPKSIIVTLDGDDFFAHENVLTYLNNVYDDPNVWMTYGQFMYYPSDSPGWAQQIPKEVIEKNSFRDHTWCSTHLRTFYAGLFQKIKKEDFIYEGKFYPMAWDLGFMFPMLEMAGHRSKFIPEVLYIYNTATPINDNKVNEALQMYLTQVIRTKEKYSKIDKLFESQENKKSKKIYIFADQWGSLFDINSHHNRDNSLKCTYELKQYCDKNGCQLIHATSPENLNDADYIVVFNLPINHLRQLAKYPKEKLILFLWEPPTTSLNYEPKYHQYFSKIYTWHDDIIDQKTYFKFYYPVLNEMVNDVQEFKNKKLCTMISMNKNSNYHNELYSQRRSIINFFEEIDEPDFDFYGMYWDKSQFKNYKGQVVRKADVLKKYKFCICYENTKGSNGYVTEKIFDCFMSGCVPIYWGAPNITQYIPKECFINREDFKSDQDLYLFIKNMSEAEYNNYINNIKAYLTSNKAQLYSINNFINIFTKACNITQGDSNE